MGRYAAAFEAHEVDGEVLPCLTMDDLRDMGIAAVGARRKLFCAIQRLHHHHPPPIPPPPPPPPPPSQSMHGIGLGEVATCYVDQISCNCDILAMLLCSLVVIELGLRLGNFDYCAWILLGIGKLFSSIFCGIEMAMPDIMWLWN
uniref:SAM domain-containing protein n=1 Tax=Leersia perrieri TaxID=77586 RepID=A0A0D9XZA1_9ORYZ